MKKIIIIAIVLATILLPNVGADNNFSFETDLVAGDSLVYEIVLNNTENYEIECTLSAQTTPNDEGIDISFSDEEFNIRAESQYALTMYINTSMFLTPETYVFTVTYMKEGKNVEPTYSPKHYNTEEDEDEEEQNEEQNNTEPELPDITEEEQQPDEPTGSNEEYNFWWIFIIIITIAIVIVAYVIKKHKGAKKNGKNRKR